MIQAEPLLFPWTNWQSHSDWLDSAMQHPDRMWQCSNLGPKTPARACVSSSRVALSLVTYPGLFVPSPLLFRVEDQWQAVGVAGCVVLICKRADTDENAQAGPSVDLLQPLTHLLRSCVSEVQNPAPSVFKSLQFFSSDHDSSWFL